MITAIQNFLQRKFRQERFKKPDPLGVHSVRSGFLKNRASSTGVIRGEALYLLARGIDGQQALKGKKENQG